MTDDELDEIFAALSAILTDSGLDWLVAQVNENIQVGQIVTRTFHRGEPEEVSAFELTTKTKRNIIVGTDPFGAADRLDHLISAIRVALADTAALEQAVGGFFTHELSTPVSDVVISAPDQEISGDNALVIVGDDAPAAAAAERVMPLLDELARRIAQP